MPPTILSITALSKCIMPNAVTHEGFYLFFNLPISDSLPPTILVCEALLNPQSEGNPSPVNGLSLPLSGLGGIKVTGPLPGLNGFLVVVVNSVVI